MAIQPQALCRFMSSMAVTMTWSTRGGATLDAPRTNRLVERQQPRSGRRRTGCFLGRDKERVPKPGELLHPDRPHGMRE
jgi:hypothetical protein